MRVFVWVHECVSRVYAADTPEQLKRILDAMCTTIQDWDVAREAIDRAYQYSDPERGILYLLRKVEVGSCNEFDYGTGFVSAIGLQPAAAVLK